MVVFFKYLFDERYLRGALRDNWLKLYDKQVGGKELLPFFLLFLKAFFLVSSNTVLVIHLPLPQLPQTKLLSFGASLLVSGCCCPATRQTPLDLASMAHMQSTFAKTLVTVLSQFVDDISVHLLALPSSQKWHTHHPLTLRSNLTLSPHSLWTTSSCACLPCLQARSGPPITQHSNLTQSPHSLWRVSLCACLPSSQKWHTHHSAQARGHTNLLAL